MNQRIDTGLLHTAQPFADYQQNTAARIDLPAEARAQHSGARVGISRAHESARSWRARCTARWACRPWRAGG